MASRSRAARQDDSIMATNNSSIVSKRSVERIYYPHEPHFFRYFVKKPQRRAPLINRGYWLRMKAIDFVVQRFLQNNANKPKLIVNLGCGYDPLPWQTMTRYAEHCSGVKFVDIDYKDLILRKRQVVTETPELNSVFSNLTISDDSSILLQSDQYVQVGFDLRGNLAELSSTLSKIADLDQTPVLFVAEVSVTYMEQQAADELIKWAASIPSSQFCLLEQILPEGPDHPFASTMLKHFNKLGTPLNSVLLHPTTAHQEYRFQENSWPAVASRSLWELWSSPGFLSSQERQTLDKFEPFDEWEEFALFACHYSLLVASNTDTYCDLEKISPSNQRIQPQASPDDEIVASVAYSEFPRTKSPRRFSSPIMIRGTDREADVVVSFAGLGTGTRVNSYDVYDMDSSNNQPFHKQGFVSGPPSRMCHTTTDVAGTGTLLVGGRLSPDQALADCWFYHKMTNTWERVDDLPKPRYRHSATLVDGDKVLVAGGKSDSTTIVDSYLLWSHRKGWQKCKVKKDFGELYEHNEEVCWPCPRFGASFATFQNLREGMLSGGLSQDGLVCQDVWIWRLNSLTEIPTLTFLSTAKTDGDPSIARFGATRARHQGQMYVVGGITKGSLLPSNREIYRFNEPPLPIHKDFKLSVIEMTSPVSFYGDFPRPLLVGVSSRSPKDTMVITDGGAVCFSFGTFWNTGCYTLDIYVIDPDEEPEIPHSWAYLETKQEKLLEESHKPAPESSTNGTHNQPNIITVPRVKLGSSADFEKLVRASQPAVIEGLDLGPCVEKWTPEYLVDSVGADRMVTIHNSPTPTMSFTTKNFTYETVPFSHFISSIQNGSSQYLRSLSSTSPSTAPTSLATDFPSLAPDFILPPELSFAQQNTHSTPLRISGPVNMWLHYDVLANILCQIRGEKTLLLFPPSDVKHFDFAPGASSCDADVFAEDGIPEAAHPFEAHLQPGDILFIPHLWLHAAQPNSGISVAVNVFFKDLENGYAAGKDVYANRDVGAYEKGRIDVQRVVQSFRGLPEDVKGFYLERLAKELRLGGGA